MRGLRMVGSLSLCGLCLLVAGVASAKDPYQKIAGELAAVASRQGAKTLEVLPFARADNRASPEGQMISGRLLSAILKRGDLAVVIGEFSSGMLDPYTARMDPGQEQEFVKTLGPPTRSSADLLVVGSYLIARGEITLNVQALQPKTGKVVYAGVEKVPNEWLPSPLEFFGIHDSYEDAVGRMAAQRNSWLKPPAPELPQPAPAAANGPKAAAPSSNGSKAVPVDFQINAPEAQKVELVGGFLFRSQGRKPMARQAQGSWKLEVYLRPGTYRYFFLVDGRRRLDETNPRRDRGYSVVTAPTSSP